MQEVIGQLLHLIVASGAIGLAVALYIWLRFRS